MSRVTALIWAVIICLLVSLGWAVNHYRDNATEYKEQRDREASRADASEAVTDNVLRTIKITNIVLETNQYAKQQIALESQRAQADIKVAVANDDCARRTVPASASDRLRKYADSLREGSIGSAASKPNF